jgi:aquaporin Z
VSGRISWIVAAGYAAAQVIGAVAAAFVLWIVAHGYQGYASSRFGIGQNTFGNASNGVVGYDWWAAFVIEVVLTGVLVTVVLASTDERNRARLAAPVAIGLTLVALYFIAIPADGGSFNPARSIGPALFADNRAVEQLWLFILAPLVGGLVAGVLYPAVFGRETDAVPGSGLGFLARRRPAPSYAWERFATHPTTPGELPVIVQDGWRWDYPTQQWVPLEDSPANTPLT